MLPRSISELKTNSVPDINQSNSNFFSGCTLRLSTSHLQQTIIQILRNDKEMNDHEASTSGTKDEIEMTQFPRTYFENDSDSDEDFDRYSYVYEIDENAEGQIISSPSNVQVHKCQFIVEGQPPTGSVPVNKITCQ
ncbi:hypothetical protein ACET3Z_004655 [Daucus carota]